MAEHLLNTDSDWIQHAHCRNEQIDPKLFFPERYEKHPGAAVLCGPCEVKAECLNYALENNLWVGIWGGKSGRQRRDLQRARRRAMRNQRG